MNAASLIISQIQKAKANSKLVCICINNIKWNNRIIGYVKQICLPDKFELEVIDENGKKKNIRTVLINSVKSLEIGGTYNDNLEMLNKHGFAEKQTHPKYFSSQKQNFHQKLRELKDSQTLCTFFFKTEFSIGVIKGIGRHEMSIRNISYEGRNDGISIFDIALLTKIRVNSSLENRITFFKDNKF